MTSRLLLAALLLTAASGGAMWPSSAVTAHAAAQDATDDQRIRALLQRLERAAQSPDASAYLALQTASADRKAAADFAATEFRQRASRVVIQERERLDLPGVLPPNGYRLIVDAFIQSGDRARVATWQIDAKRVDDVWLVADQTTISAVENLYHLTLNPAKQFDAKNFTIRSEDFELTLVEGSVFTVDTDLGTTGLILTGRGDIRFAPAPTSEREQVKIFSGAESLETRFEAAYIRVGTLSDHADPALLKPRATVDQREFRRADQIFREESGKSFIVDLADLSRDTWSLPPGTNDFLAEVRTRKFDTLTYAHSSSEPEDISFFDRRRHRNIASYASKDKLTSRGRFYNEDDLAPYDVLDYDIEIVSQPERLWIDGRATMRLRVAASSINQLNIRLADSLVVRSVESDLFGRLFSLRVANQNMVIVNLPATVLQDSEMLITFKYAGRLEPQAPERETLQVEPGNQGQPPVPDMFDDPFVVKPEANFLYSNTSYWYPQSTITDYALATMQITVPAIYGCVASGELSPESPQLIPAAGQVPARRVYRFSTERPLRYLAFLATKFTRVNRTVVAFDRAPALDVEPGDDPPVVPYDKLDLIVEANPRQVGRAREWAERLSDVTKFYESIVGDSPYGAFTLAVLENNLPGGHSPGYFAILNQPLPTSQLTWRNDPAAFANYPEFFLAHEVAHQWWGQAVGWRNYHEQWLSEGFAQYFAALYAQHYRGDDVFEGVMRQMRRWAIDESDQGPIYLGYRVGHIKNDGRAYRAVVYNKGAAVLHMLRRLIGDDAFIRGLRRFYTEARYTKVGSDDFRVAMEAEAGRPLERFFERWVYGSSLPRLSFSYKVETPAGASKPEVVLHFEQAGEIFDVPVTVTLQFADRKPLEVVVPVTEKTVDVRVPLEGTLRGVDVNRDDGTLAEITRN
jgi:hypothetical protein